MEYHLQQDAVAISVRDFGAELRSLNYQGQEFMWSADPDYWAKTSPVLFPFIGGLKRDAYFYKGKKYFGKKHGFARDNNFQLLHKSTDKLSFVFCSNEQTLENYPFEFELEIHYHLFPQGLKIGYKVLNLSDYPMYFSLGAHPAFALPLNEHIQISDYYLEFAQEENTAAYQLDGLLLGQEKFPPLQGNILRLHPDIFAKDAMVFENLRSESIRLKCQKSTREVQVDFKGFPYLALWNVPNAAFLCIEPWYGINDFTNSNGVLEDKKGIQKLEAKALFEAEMSIFLKL